MDGIKPLIALTLLLKLICNVYGDVNANCDAVRDCLQDPGSSASVVLRTLKEELMQEIDERFQRLQRLQNKDPGLRLAGGENEAEGRLEIEYNGEWGTVCDDDFDARDATVACRSLGFDEFPGRVVGSKFGPGNGTIWMDNVNCSETDESFRNCEHRGWGTHNCAHNEDVSISCTDPGILVQQHFNGTTFFQRSWDKFKTGFGEPAGNYWIGNEQLHQLTSERQYKLRIVLQAKANRRWYWAEYGVFRVDSEATNYRLTISGYNGTAGDSMTCGGLAYCDLNGMGFTSKDNDNDNCPNLNCAVKSQYTGTPECGGGFWHKCCHTARINLPSGCSPGFSWQNLPIDNKDLLYSSMSLL